MDIQKDVASWKLEEDDSSSAASDQDSAVEITVAFKEDEIDKDDTTAEQHLLEGKDIQVKPAASSTGPCSHLVEVLHRLISALRGCFEA